LLLQNNPDDLPRAHFTLPVPTSPNPNPSLRASVSVGLPPPAAPEPMNTSGTSPPAAVSSGEPSRVPESSAGDPGAPTSSSVIG
jgi:hypothetical protein